MPRVRVAPPRRPVRRRPANGLFAWPPTPRAKLLGLAVGGAMALLGPSLYVWYAGVPGVVGNALAGLQRGALSATASAGLAVQEIYVAGRGETSRAQVLAALDVTRGAPILGFSPAHARAELERLPWVKDAAVERRLPDTIHVRLVERRPLALWQNDGRITVIDHDGREISGADPARFSALPLVVGDDAPQHAIQLLALLALEPDLGRRVTAAVRVGGRRWNLRMDAGDGAKIDVHLPEINPGAAWARLAELERSKKLLDRSISVIDMRIPDRLIVRANGDAPAAPARGRRSSNRPT